MASEIRSNKIYNSTGTGTPETFTPSPGDVSKKIATTEFVKGELDSFTSVEINDTTPATDKVYSSQKVETELSALESSINENLGNLDLTSDSNLAQIQAISLYF